MSKFDTYHRYWLVEQTFNYEGIIVRGFRLMTNKEKLQWEESVSKLEFPLDFFIGGGNCIYFATLEDYMECITSDLITKTEYKNLKNVHGINYNWKDLPGVR